MHPVQRTSTWKKTGLAAAIMVLVAAAGVWAKSGIVVSRSAPAVNEAAASGMSPFDMMRNHRMDLPSGEYVDPF